MRGVRWIALASAALAACSPTYDWRELRPEGSLASATFPCKPERHARAVFLAGASTQMSLLACSAGGTTFALAFADIKDPALVGAALDELGLAAQSNLKVSAPAASQALAVPGMTPHAHAAQWRWQGQLPDGRAVHERVALFVYGTRVYQATMLGAALDADAQEMFFGGLRVTR